MEWKTLELKIFKQEDSQYNSTVMHIQTADLNSNSVQHILQKDSNYFSFSYKDMKWKSCKRTNQKLRKSAQENNNTGYLQHQKEW